MRSAYAFIYPFNYIVFIKELCAAFKCFLPHISSIGAAKLPCRYSDTSQFQSYFLSFNFKTISPFSLIFFTSASDMQATIYKPSWLPWTDHNREMKSLKNVTASLQNYKNLLISSPLLHKEKKNSCIDNNTNLITRNKRFISMFLKKSNKNTVSYYFRWHDPNQWFEFQEIYYFCKDKMRRQSCVQYFEKKCGK